VRKKRPGRCSNTVPASQNKPLVVWLLGGCCDATNTTLNVDQFVLQDGRTYRTKVAT
jgi:hypothetical protein